MVSLFRLGKDEKPLTFGGLPGIIIKSGSYGEVA